MLLATHCRSVSQRGDHVGSQDYTSLRNQHITFQAAIRFTDSTVKLSAADDKDKKGALFASEVIRQAYDLLIHHFTRILLTSYVLSKPRSQS